MKKVITLQYVDPPKEGKKAWMAKDRDGNRYVVGRAVDPGQLPKGTPIEADISRPQGFNMDVLGGFKIAQGEAAKQAEAHDSVAGMTRVVADAIRAGYVQKPSDMKVWAMAYRELVREYTTPPSVKEIVQDTAAGFQVESSIPEPPDWVS